MFSKKSVFSLALAFVTTVGIGHANAKTRTLSGKISGSFTNTQSDTNNDGNDAVLLGVSTIGSLVVGFDIVTDGGDNTAYAALQTPDSERSKLYLIDLTTGAASFIGKIGGPVPLTSLTAIGPM